MKKNKVIIVVLSIFITVNVFAITTPSTTANNKSSVITNITKS